MILCDFDPERRAVINPDDIVDKIEGMPETLISCFSKTTFDRLIGELDAEEFYHLKGANGPKPIYRASYKGKEFAFMMVAVGSSICVGELEDVIYMGAKKIVIFGTCGVLDSSISDCSVIIPTAAVRDEGVSYHYVPASDEISVNGKYIKTFKDFLDELELEYTVGKVWTTDALYRETPNKVKKRKEMGCICVDMECSAVSALAKFRGVDVLHFFYAADNLDADEWDSRSLANEALLVEKDKIAVLALEMGLRI